METPRTLFGLPLIVRDDLPEGFIGLEPAEAAVARKQRDHERKLKIIENLLAGGFTVTTAPNVLEPTASLPDTFKPALDQIMAERNNRDPAEQFYRDRMSHVDLDDLP